MHETCFNLLRYAKLLLAWKCVCAASRACVCVPLAGLRSRPLSSQIHWIIWTAGMVFYACTSFMLNTQLWSNVDTTTSYLSVVRRERRKQQKRARILYLKNKNLIKTSPRKKGVLYCARTQCEPRETWSTKARLCWRQYQKLQKMMWCLITRSLWHREMLRTQRKTESIDFIVAEQGVCVGSQMCVRVKCWEHKTIEAHSGLPFSFLPSGDSRDIELRQQKRISIRVSKSERHCAEKGLMEAQLGALFT